MKIKHLFLLILIALSGCSQVKSTSILLPTETLDVISSVTLADDPKTDEHLREIREGQRLGELIIDAIEKHYLDKGIYPDELPNLVPTYLQEIPLTETGESFRYRQSPDIYVVGFDLVTKKGAYCAYIKRLDIWEFGFGANP